MNANDSKKLLSKDFLSKNNSPQELLKRLEVLSDFLLKKVEQEGENELEHVAKSLLQDHIFKNKDDAVRLTAACCLADVIRVYAPNSPFNDEQTKKIFKLFIQQLGGLEHVESPLANKIAYLLERLAVVKAFVLVADFEDVKLKLFNQMFSVIREDHPKMVVIHVLDTLMSVIEESDTVSQELLEVILKHLISEEENHESPRLLAWHLIYRCAEKLKPYLTEYINNLLEVKNTQNELREQSHKLIFELNLINPDLISEVIPHLEEELTVDNLDVRSEVVQLLANMFSTKDSSLATNYRALYVTFLQRFKDINSGIREVMIVDFAKPFILNITDTKLVEQVQNELKLKLLDPIEKVRLAAVTVTCECAELVPETMTASLLQELEKRLRDKKTEVRSVALNLIAHLYQSLCVKFGLLSEWKQKLRDLYSWIPNKIFHTFFLPSIDDKCRADEVIQEKLLPQDSSSSDSARFLMDVISCLDNHGIQALSYYVREKKSFRDDFSAYLEMRKAKAKDVDEEKLNQKMSVLGSKLPEEGFKEGFKKLFHSMEDAKLFDDLTVIVKSSSSDKEILKAKKSIQKSFSKGKKDSKKKDYLNHILRKLSMGNVDSSQVKLFMKQIKNENDAVFKTAMLKFVEDLSFTFPNFFGDSTDYIAKFISSGDDQVLDSGLQIIANAPHLFSNTDFAHSMKESLNNVCLEGTATQTRKAIQAISKGYAQKVARVTLGKLAQSLFDQGKEKKSRPAAFDGLDELCVVSPSSFDAVATDSVRLVLDEVIPKQPKSNQNEVTNSEPSDECAAKLSGMRMVTTFLLASEDEALASQYMQLLFSILSAHGATLLDKKRRVDEEKDRTSKSDRSFVRTVATCSLLRLAENRNYEKQITVENFQNLARQTEDEFHEVRKEILGQLFLGLKEVQRLPLRYTALLVLYATDPDKDLVTQAKKHLQHVINLRRHVLKQTSDIDSNALTALLPENSLPYVVHLLAHSSYFPSDAPHYLNTHKYLTFYLEPILVKEDNYPFLIELLQFIKQTEDVQDPKSNNIHVISDLSLLILQQKMDSKRAFKSIFEALMNRKHTGTVYLPPKLFRQPEGNQLDTKSYLPLGFQFAKKTNKFASLLEEQDDQEKTPKTAKDTSPKKRKAVEEESSSSEEQNEDFNDIIKPSPAKKAKVTSGKKNQKAVESEAETSPQKSPAVAKKTKKIAEKPAALKKPKDAGITKPKAMRKAKEAASPKKQTKPSTKEIPKKQTKPSAKESPKTTPKKATQTPSPKKTTPAKAAAKTTPVKKTAPKGRKAASTNSQKGLKQTTLTKTGAVKK